MSDYISFPEEIVCEILKRLSIDDAVRCTSVCKSWYSLITSPSFISLHSKQIASTNKDLLLVRDYRSKQPQKELYSLHFDDDESFGESKRRLDFPVKCWYKDSFFRVIDSVNGVLCLSDDVHIYTEEIVLWNPSISKYVTLPEPLFGYCTIGGFKHSVGFGFDATINDFKVVRVVYLVGRESRVPPKVEIYEPRVGSWREVDAKGFSYVIDEKSPQVFLHGNVHWVIGCKDHDFWKQLNSTNLIVLFDLKSEVFGVMKVPDSLNEHHLKQDFCVSVLEGSLSLIHHTRSENGNTCCIWVMKRYGVPDSWTKLFSVDVKVLSRYSASQTWGVWQIIGFRRNSEALLKVESRSSYLSNHLLVSFEPKSRQTKTLAPFGKWESLHVDNFVESLALLGVKGVSVPKYESADTISADEESNDQEEGSRYWGPADPPLPPSAHIQVNWFG